MEPSARILVVMARAPVVGSVKTRLAQRVGAEAACALYRAFVADIAARFASPAWSLVWAVTPAGADLTPLIGSDAVQFAQDGEDLGARMQSCFARLLRDHARRVVMIGADAPHLAETAIVAAFSALEQYDAVLMPTRDGGYCLVGLRAPHDIFAGIPMGTAQVFESTRARLDALGLRCHLLPASFDIDELDDVAELSRLIARGEATLPQTANVLRQWQAGGIL
jgi:rSAM/selenodomain-associated transferase 1